MFILFDSQSIDSCEANLKKKPIRQPKSVFLFLIPNSRFMIYYIIRKTLEKSPVVMGFAGMNIEYKTL